MIKKHRRLMAALLCLVMMLSLAACGTAGTAEEHDHDHESEIQAPASPEVTSLEDGTVPLAEGPEGAPEMADGTGNDLTAVQSDPQPAGDAPAAPPEQVQEDTPEPQPTTSSGGGESGGGQSGGTSGGTSSDDVAADGHVHNWVTKSEVVSNDCYYGPTERIYDECTICHVTAHTALRPSSSWPKKEHTWVTSYTEHGACPKKSIVHKTCSVCGFSEVEYIGGTTKNGDHEWGPWSEATGTVCTGTVRERRCTVCGTVDTQSSGSGSHAWVWKETPASCTSPGTKWQECTRCGATQNQQTTSPKAHKWEADDGNCATPIKCALCGAIVQPAMTHKYSSTYSHDNVQHWRQCTNPGCTQRTDVGAHKGTTSNDCTRLSSCSVCGIAGGSSGMSHNFDGSGGYIISSTRGHQIRCGNPGCTQVSTERPHDKPGTVAKCGEELDCVCGYPLVRGSSSHNFGSWTATASGHSRTCKTCGYVESNTHTSTSTGTGSCTATISCSVCGYVLSRGNGSHSFGVWMSNGSTHYRTCTHPGCTAIESSAHTGGKATCTSAAVCSICGATYGSKAAGTHVGGTELRNARPAEVGKAGYTGDTYCLGCGKMISAGTTIKALEEDHKHSFSSSWRSDSGSHWHQCSCGEHKDEAAHSFSNGKCTVCGAADPDYRVCSGGSHVGGTELRDVKAAEVGKTGYSGDLVCTSCGAVISRGHTIAALKEDHEHEYSVTWRTDGTSHWRDCPCGEITRKAAHTFVNGACSVCGVADPNAKEAAHTHSFGSLHSNGQYHWRECTTCGFQAEKAAHVMLNGACMTCGYKASNMESVQDVKTQDWFYEPVKQVLEAGLLSGGKSAGETTSFKPEEKVVLAEVVDAIYRLAGSPAAASENRFTDVGEDDYFASAATWATENSIVDIFGESFEGDKATTLQEMITFLWRFAKTAGWDVEASEEVELPNAEEIDDYAAEAMAWAAEAGLIAGIDESEEAAMSPDGVVTRAEAAAILANFMEMIEENGLPEIENGVEEIEG